MLRIIYIIIAAAIFWCGAWFYGAPKNLETTLAFFQSSKDTHHTVQYTEFHQSGFPNRYDVTINDIEILENGTIRILYLPFIQIFRLVYDKNHRILSFAKNVNLYGHSLTWETAQASIVTQNQNNRINFIATDFLFQFDDNRGFSSDKIQIALQETAESPNITKIFIRFENTLLPQANTPKDYEANFDIQRIGINDLTGFPDVTQRILPIILRHLNITSSSQLHEIIDLF